MPKFRFDPKPLGFTAGDHGPDVRRAARSAAFEPCVVFRPGVEAIMGGLSLAHVRACHRSPTTGETYVAQTP